MREKLKGRRIADGGNWANVVIATLGLAGTVMAGWIGYQSGSKAVDKDYVAMATTILEKKEASPELRRWSVDVLSKLSPVPFGAKLKDELSKDGLSGAHLVLSRFDPPKLLVEPCPDLLKDTGRAIGDALALKVVNEYKRCRIRHEFLVSWFRDINKMVDDLNKERADSKPSTADE